MHAYLSPCLGKRISIFLGCRPSWDPITVYLAVMGDTTLYTSLQAGTNTVDYVGNENWDTSNTGSNMYHVYMDNNHAGDVTRILDDILCAAPCGVSGVGGCENYTLQSMLNCYPGHGADDPSGSDQVLY